MFVILDTQTGEWIRAIPWTGYEIVQGTTTVPADSTGARVFKRKSDLASHVSQNSGFYRHHASRLVVQELELLPKDQIPMTEILEAKKKRDAAKQEEAKRRAAEFKERQIARLQAELTKLKDGT